ncbi:MAG: hypothetical protein GXZ03_07420 [Proteiniphilum sp.]|nr:hypothetical protein [Proteiniphilum sp.]
MSQKVNLKTLETSWMRRLTNKEFAFTVELFANVIKDNAAGNILVLKALKKFSEYNEILQSMVNVRTSHPLTEEIATLHRQRKKQMYVIIGNCKAVAPNMSNEPYVINTQHVDYWLERFGKRLYDYGINKMTSIVRTMQREIASLPDLQEAIENGYNNMSKDFELLFQINESIVEAQNQRAYDLQKAKPKYSIVDLRRHVYILFKGIFFCINFEAKDGDEPEPMILLNLIMYKHIAEHKKALLLHEASRAKKKKAKQSTDTHNKNAEKDKG